MNNHTIPLNDRIITMMVGLRHYTTISLIDLCDGLHYDRTNPDDRHEFSLFVTTGQNLGWLTIDTEAFTVTLTPTGRGIADTMARVMAADGMQSMAELEEEVRDGYINGYPSWDDAPEYPEDWPS